MYADDHAPPHFHVLSADGGYMVDIATLAIIRGTAPAGHSDGALEWAAANKALLTAKWDEYNERD
ncbi:DUF4160 domain-containing protein [Stappia sp. F7233]|uniref:DUF4160 domain-containing protein n=1 Tax=Stappia albiluteola TaxID=2758565 RepID=A0A839AC93_9HYPH|nr:DUF4160 domain-containing protein [Stappia albiluteola]